MDATAPFPATRRPARPCWLPSLLCLAVLAATGTAQAGGETGAGPADTAAAVAPQAAGSAPANGEPGPKPYGSGYEARGLAAAGTQPAQAGDRTGSAGEARGLPMRPIDRSPSSHRHGGGAGRGGRR